MKTINSFIVLLLLNLVFISINGLDNNIYVKDKAELIKAIDKIEDNEIIYLSDNIILDNKLEIKKSLILDLNNFEITIRSGNEGIICGNRKFNGAEVYLKRSDGGKYTLEEIEEYIPESYDKKNKILKKGYWITRYEKRWIPKDFISTVIKNKYEYDDDIDITIKNGIIHMENASNGKDATDYKASINGENGASPYPVITVISGTLNLSSVKLYGGNGGNGGNGGYQKLYHIPFINSGNGGNGGNAGNGGDAVLVLENSTISIDNSSRLIPGYAGQIGKGKKENPNYWLFPGIKGEDGKYGKNGNSISGTGKIIRVN